MVLHLSEATGGYVSICTLKVQGKQALGRGLYVIKLQLTMHCRKFADAVFLRNSNRELLKVPCAGARQCGHMALHPDFARRRSVLHKPLNRTCCVFDALTRSSRRHRSASGARAAPPQQTRTGGR